MTLRCPACAAESPAGMIFCLRCGTALTRDCPACGFASPADAAFCGRCATALVADVTPSPLPPGAGSHADPASPAGVAPAALAAERRQLTVMFCDLVESTALSRRLDPEELRDVIAAYHEAAAGVVRRLGGHVAQYLGDGVLVYFGYPRAHEDDPIRAAHAALAILGELPRLNALLGRTTPAVARDPLAVRIGIHTGPVVVGAMGRHAGGEEMALGDTVNIAARLQEVAGPGGIAVSAATRRLLREVFVLEDAGSHRLKGIAEAFAVTRVLGVRSASPGRARGAEAPLATPLVGREQELALLVDRWEQAREGHGQVVALSAEAGMGKSRLVRTLGERVRDGAPRWLESGGSAYHEQSAFYPVVDLLRQAFGVEEGDPPETQLAAVRGALDAAGLEASEALPLLAGVLGLPVPDDFPTLDHLGPELRRRRTLEAVAGWLCAASADRPVVLVVEDLHWVDPSSMEVLRVLLEEVPTCRVLVVLTLRPERELPWPARSHFVHLTLHPLTRRQVVTIAAHVAGARRLPAAMVDYVAAKTDGVPLFVEELTKAIVESEPHAGAAGASVHAVPSTLQDSLMARLDRLGPSKEIAQLAAVLGREFPRDVLEAVAGRDAHALDRDLDRLVAAELLYRRGVPPRVVYTFKHALVQETAYQSLLRRVRQRHHATVARVLETRFPERAAAEPEVIARHYDEAGDHPAAIDAYERAAERAIERSATHEAIGHLRRGLELLDALPAEAARPRQELRFNVKLGARLVEARGYGDAEVCRAYERARVLCQDVADAPELFRVLWGLSVYYQARNELEIASEMGDELLGVAERAGDPSLLIMAHMARGSPSYWQGRYATCLERVEQTLALYDPARHHALAHVYGEDPGVSSRIYQSQALWQLGFPDRALAAIRAAVGVAEEGRHPFSLGYALCFEAAIHMLRGEHAEAAAWAERAIALAEEQYLPLWLGAARFYRGWATVESSAGEAGLAVMEAALEELVATGTEVGSSSMIAVLAGAHARLGHAEKARGGLALARELAALRRSPFWDPEIERLEGELALLGPTPATAEAEGHFARALELADELGARSLALRAATSLARLLQRDGRRAEAAAILAPRYEGFSEGWDTADLRTARALLDALA